MENIEVLAEALRKKYGHVAIMGDKTGWHVKVGEWKYGDSVNEPGTLEWQSLSGIHCGLTEALTNTGTDGPTVETVAQMFAIGDEVHVKAWRSKKTCIVISTYVEGSIRYYNIKNTDGIGGVWPEGELEVL